MGYFEIFAGALAGFYALIPSYGLAIILLTLAVRVLLLPLSIKQTRSMREMQRIGPEVKKLQTKYKGNRQKMNEEMMRLYKEHGVNPFGGCAPLALQMPVLFALFYVIRRPLKYLGYRAVEASGGVVEFIPREVTGFMGQLKDSALASELFNNTLSVHRFLGLRLDCSSALALRGDNSEILSQGCGSGLVSALPYLALVAAMGFTTYYQQRQMQSVQGAQGVQTPQAQQMQAITKFMPLMLMVFSFSFPSGLVIYWLTTNLWTIVQQRIILRTVPPVLPPAEDGRVAEEGAGKGSPALTGRKGSGSSPRKTPTKPGGRSGSAGGKKPVAASSSKARPASKKKRKR